MGLRLEQSAFPVIETTFYVLSKALRHRLQKSFATTRLTDRFNGFGETNTLTSAVKRGLDTTLNRCVPFIRCLFLPRRQIVIEATKQLTGKGTTLCYVER